MLDLVNVLDVTCGTIQLDQIIVDILKGIVFLIQVGVPIILVVLGMLDMGKAVMSQKEDEIKKNQSLLIKRVIYAVVVFLVISIVRLVLSFIGTSAGSALECFNSIFGA